MNSIAPLTHPRAIFRLGATLVVAALAFATVHFARAGAIFAPRVPRFADAAIACEGTHCTVDHRRIKMLARALNFVRLVPHCGGQHAARGMRIYALRPGSLLARLGLRNGDVIVSSGGHAVCDPDVALWQYIPRPWPATIEVVIDRNGRPMTFTYDVR